MDSDLFTKEINKGVEKKYLDLSKTNLGAPSTAVKYKEIYDQLKSKLDLLDKETLVHGLAFKLIKAQEFNCTKCHQNALIHGINPDCEICSKIIEDKIKYFFLIE